MKLPNGEQAIIDVPRKLIGYCLNPEHRTGRNKARVFRELLGIEIEHAELLADALRRAAVEQPARIKESTVDGVKYELDFLMYGLRGSAMIRSGWILERGTTRPRLVTCYVKR